MNLANDLVKNKNQNFHRFIDGYHRHKGLVSKKFCRQNSVDVITPMCIKIRAMKFCRLIVVFKQAEFRGKMSYG